MQTSPSGLSPVVDQVACGVDLVLVKADQRQDLRRVNDRRIHPASTQVVQEHGVENDTRRRTQAERNIRNAEDGIRLGQLRANRPIASTVSTAFLRSSSIPVEIGSASGIKEDVVRRDPELRGLIVCARRDLNLPSAAGGPFPLHRSNR